MERSPLPSERAEFSGKMLNATHRQKHIEQDAQLLENRIALLKKEEQRAWRKIQQTKKRADEIVSMRRENEARQAEKKKMAEQAEEREKVLAAEHHKLEERARLARAKNLEQMYLTKRSDFMSGPPSAHHAGPGSHMCRLPGGQQAAHRTDPHKEGTSHPPRSRPSRCCATSPKRG